MHEELVCCIICSFSASTQKPIRLNPYAVFIYYLIFILFQKSYLINYYFRIKWNGVLRFNRNKKGKMYI